jgi:Outer membrane protein beta-barrel domain
MRDLLKLFFLLIAGNIFSQSDSLSVTKTPIDSLYREDQFYFGVSINLFENKPRGFSANTISPSFTAGFLRDMPFNKNRTLAIAAGFGITYNKFSNNLVVVESSDLNTYSTIDASETYDKNKLEQISVDLPLEIRWRNSTPESHQFFRIYSGIKMSYLVFSKSKFINSEKTSLVFGNDDLNKLRLSAYLTFGYNTWNGYISYGFTPLFKDSILLKNESIGLNPINLGFMFYIL